MNKIVLLVLCSSSLQAAEIDTKPLAKWLKSQANDKTVVADFVQIRKLTTLNREISNNGKLYIQYPDKFLWEIGKPAKVKILKVGEKITLQNLKKKTVSQFKANSAEGRKYSFMTSKLASSLPQFEKNFTVTRTWSKEGIYYVLFQPKLNKLRKNVPYLALGIKSDANRLALFEMHLKDKSVLRTEFINYQTNSKISADVFKPLNNEK